MIADQNFYDTFYNFLSYGFGAEVIQGQTFGYGRRWKLHLRSNTAFHELFLFVSVFVIILLPMLKKHSESNWSAPQMCELY